MTGKKNKIKTLEYRCEKRRNAINARDEFTVTRMKSDQRAFSLTQASRLPILSSRPSPYPSCCPSFTLECQRKKRIEVMASQTKQA